ncbi:hypothetical protein [Siminovitchia terrae]|uniref:hypothetical protein n=1 Tax=Siminovitchia terrae TaxID=1914933 RepID=UPI001BB44FE9|nr:hypothetical protein [Siminovitchia terrae]
MVFNSEGVKTLLNKVKASGGCHRFSKEIYRAELDKIWAQIRQGAFDIRYVRVIKSLSKTCKLRNPYQTSYRKWI